MLILKNFVLLSLIILIGSCTTKNFDKVQNIANYSIEVDTPNDKYNIYIILAPQHLEVNIIHMKLN